MDFRCVALTLLTAIFTILLPLTADAESSIPFSPLMPQPTRINSLYDLRDFADVIRLYDEPVSSFFADPRLTAVTREFGPAVIPAGPLPYRSELSIASPTPWSSWWFPKIDDSLFRDPDSTLAKYDVYRAEIYRQAGKPAPNSARDYEQKSFNPRSLTWEGLCDAWSLAAISHSEPKQPVNVKVGGKTVTFSVGDQKALLLKTYEGVDDKDLKYYGQKFTGDANGWIYPDIFPEQFHRFIQVQLYEKKQPFLMDHDPGVEIWSVPVYKANFIINAIPGQPNAVFVQAWLYSAESVQATEKDFVGIREAVREYNYVLTGRRNAKGDLVVESGYWVKGPDGVDSRQDHPDYFVKAVDPNKLSRKSWNPEIEVDIVDKILATQR